MCRPALTAESRLRCDRWRDKRRSCYSFSCRNLLQSCARAPHKNSHVAVIGMHGRVRPPSAGYPVEQPQSKSNIFPIMYAPARPPAAAPKP